ncbi:MAG: anaerobic ribonucleoside-triphosphate reductase [Rubrivivax sp.]
MSHSQTPLVHPQLEEHERTRCEVWTRVMGYHRPMASFNIGKQGEFLDRRYFDEPGRPAAAAADVTATVECGCA